VAREIRYLPAAQQDLLDTVDWIATDSTSRAMAWVDDVDRRVQALVANPELGRRPRNERIAKQGYRIMVLDAYLMFYTSSPQDIIIHRVLRGARDYDSIL
jgi:toxin ParE1/3/4